MLPALEQMGIRMLVNECETIKRGGQCIYLAGIDDAHFYQTDNIEMAASGIPSDAFSILLSHTPEVCEEASYLEFNLMLCGHTHGGQICLPGRIPMVLNSVLPRYMGSGAWKYRSMFGYVGRRRLIHNPRSVQLSARNHAALPAVELTSSILPDTAQFHRQPGRSQHFVDFFASFNVIANSALRKLLRWNPTDKNSQNFREAFVEVD